MKAIFEESLKEKLKERVKELESGKDTSWIPDLDEDMRAASDLLEKTPERVEYCLLYTSPSPRDGLLSRMPSSA